MLTERSVMCVLDPEFETIETFDFKLCTHCMLDVGHRCEEGACSYEVLPGKPRPSPAFTFTSINVLF